MKNTIFTGAGVAIITPMLQDGSVDFEGLKKLIDFQIDNGTDAIIICGTTGESSTLSDEEHRDCIRCAVEHTHNRIPVIAGTGSNDTKYAIELSQEAQELGADGLLLVTPYYNKCTQRGLIAHYTAIADSVDIPIILYNVPSRTGVNITPETIVALCKEYENIAGVTVPAFQELKDCLQMTTYIMNEIKVNEHILDDDKYLFIFSVEEVNRLAREGMPFRDAYKKVGLDIEAGKFTHDKQVHHTHEGSIGNLCNDEISALMQQVVDGFNFCGMEQAEKALLGR